NGNTLAGVHCTANLPLKNATFISREAFARPMDRFDRRGRRDGSTTDSCVLAADGRTRGPERGVARRNKWYGKALRTQRSHVCNVPGEIAPGPCRALARSTRAR